jgi:hypothetical protein
MSNWRENPLAFEPKRVIAHDSWWTRADVQHDRAAFQQRVLENDRERLSKQSSHFTHDKFPPNPKYDK